LIALIKAFSLTAGTHIENTATARTLDALASRHAMMIFQERMDSADHSNWRPCGGDPPSKETYRLSVSFIFFGLILKLKQATRHNPSEEEGKKNCPQIEDYITR
jgi:hypothetical protein